ADGRAKLFVTHRLLQLRREMPDLFASAGYQPLAQRDRSLLAFARTTANAKPNGDWLVVVVPRLFAANPEQLTIALPAGAPARWRDVLSGDTLRARDGVLPVARALRAGFPVVAVPR